MAPSLSMRMSGASSTDMPVASDHDEQKGLCQLCGDEFADGQESNGVLRRESRTIPGPYSHVQSAS